MNCHRIGNSQRSVSLELATRFDDLRQNRKTYQPDCKPTGDSSSLALPSVFVGVVNARINFSDRALHQFHRIRSMTALVRARLLEVPRGLLANAVRRLACVAAFPGPELSIVNPTRKREMPP